MEKNHLIWNKLADLYQEKFMDLDIYNDSYDLFLQLIAPKPATILEIGCGPGNISRYLLTKRPDLNITGIDVAPNMVALAKQNNPSAQFQVMDAQSINSLQTHFDAIIVGFCLPYLDREAVQKLIKDAAQILNKNGVLYLSTIEGEYEQSQLVTGSTGDQMFNYYYSENFLLSLLKNHLLTLRHSLKKGYPLKDNTLQSHLMLIAQK